MTVAYINEAFGLPGDYLKNELKISDKNYPNITLHKVAQDAGESDNIFLETLKNAIKQWKH